jgi:hypothetical protein
MSSRIAGGVFQLGLGGKAGANVGGDPGWCGSKQSGACQIKAKGEESGGHQAMFSSVTKLPNLQLEAMHIFASHP